MNDDTDDARIARHRDLHRTVHPDIARAAQDRMHEALVQIVEALSLIDRVATRKESEVTYETMQRSRFDRPTSWRRKYTLADARSDARSAAICLRKAWEIIEPSGK